MKILRLTLRNLASLAGTHTVDFEREPLRSSGLFSISGPTGSGKSTLLDGLCLALYEDTPRLASASGTKLPDVGANEITQKDPANLLRRGEVEGFAEVAFIGVDGQVYTSQWSIRRARQKADGALQNAEMVLWRGNVRGGEGAVPECGGKKSEVLAAIAAKVGLSFEQFTRAVLLAQNEFAVFLKSDDKDRAEILQALTGTERFERISIRTFERDREERCALATLEGTMAGQASLAPEPRAAAEAELEKATALLDMARRQVHERELHAAWFARRRDLAANHAAAEAKWKESIAVRDGMAARGIEMAEAEHVAREARSLHDAERRALEQHDAMLQSLAIRRAEVNQRDQVVAAARRRLDGARAADASAQHTLLAATESLQRARVLDAQLTPLASRKTEKQRERTVAEAVLQTHEGRMGRIDLDLAECQARIQTGEEKRQRHGWIAPALAEAPAWSDRLKIVVMRRGEAARALAAVKSSDEAEGKARAEVERTRLSLAEATRLHQAREAARRAPEVELKQIDPETLAAERRALESRRVVLSDARSELSRWLDLTARVDVLRAAIGLLQSDANEQVRQLAMRREELPSGLTRFETTRANRMLAEAAVAKQTILLRETLRAGDPCPVCGAIEHPYAAHAPIVDATLQALREQEHAAERKLSEVREQIARLDTATKALREQEAAQTRDLARLQAEGAAASGRMAATFAQADLGHVLEAERKGAIEEAFRVLEQRKVGLEEKEFRYRAAAKAHAVARDACDVSHAALAAVEKRRATGDAEFATITAETRAARDTAARADAARAQAEREIAVLCEQLGADARVRFAEDAAGFAESFSVAVTELRALDAELVARRVALGKLTVERDEVAKSTSAAKAALASLRDEENAAWRDHAGVLAARAQVLDGRAVDVVERELVAATNGARSVLDSTVLQLAEAEKMVSASRASLVAAEKAIAEANTRRTQATEAMDLWIARYVTQSVGSSRVDLQACKLEYSIVSPK